MKVKIKAKKKSIHPKIIQNIPATINPGIPTVFAYNEVDTGTPVSYSEVSTGTDITYTEVKAA